MEDQPKSSSMAGVSVRAWLAIILVVTCCVLAAIGREVTEPIKTLTIAAVSFYFGNTARKT